MSDTPETDALRERFLTAGEWPDLFAHARRLERERDEAKKEIEGWRNKWECAVEMAARAENTVNNLINLIADIRVAVGDKEGQLTQDELAERCRMLKREYDSSY